ncbi:MAG: AMP-binding protein [Rhodococcus sp. (in: high G+C Gram-positive bacteria)]|uniref:AMP-binding protein n=1 Tax=Rhodococcus sp. TaxID=1831 RepID=UPI003BB554B9
MNESTTPGLPRHAESGGSMSTAEIKARIEAMYAHDDTPPRSDRPTRRGGVSRRRTAVA